MTEKILITSGCSFSECITPQIKTWPKHLADHLSSYKHVSKAMGSQGNGIISRGIIYEVSEALKVYKPEDILVGVMWSGPDRHDFYINDAKFIGNVDNWAENPTGFIENQKNWVILNWGWKNQFALNYYGMFYEKNGSYIYSFEHILRTQWFLQANNIPFFMSTYTSVVMPEFYRTHQEMKHLFDLIELSNFLPVEGEYEWCRDYSGLDFPIPGDFHPSSEQHKKFTELVIIPFLTEKGLI